MMPVTKMEGKKMGPKFLGAAALFFIISLNAGPRIWAQVSTQDSLIVVPIAIASGQTTVGITISMANSIPVSALTGRMVFDTNIIAPQVSGVNVTMNQVGRGTALSSFAASSPQNGVVNFLMVSDFVSPIQRIGIGSGPICRITFNVRTTADTTVCVLLQDDAFDEFAIKNELSDTSGFILITPSLLGGSLQIGAGSASGGCGPITPPPPSGNAPVINSIANQSVPQGSILQFTVTASDPNGDNVTLSATSLPQNATFNTVTGDSVVTGTFTFTPSLSQLGSFTATFRAQDDAVPSLSTTRSVSINVTEVERDILFSSSVTGQAPTGGIPGKSPAFFPIDLTARAKVFGVQFDLQIDTGIITLDSIIATSRLTNFVIDFRNIGGQLDRFRVIAFSLTGDSVRPSTTPTIMHLALSVSPNALPGKTDVVIDSGYESVNPDPRIPSQSMLTQSGEFFIDRFGDVNGDTLVNVADLVALVGFILGNYPFTPRQFDAADTDQDSVANIIDLVNIINLIFGTPLPPLAPPFPGPPATLAMNAKDFATNPSQPIRLEADLPTEIAGVQVHIAYDPKEVRLESPQKTLASQGLVLKSLDNAPGRMSFVLYNLGSEQNELQAGKSAIVNIPATRLTNGGDTLGPKITITRAFLSTGKGVGVPVKSVGGNLPREFALFQNYPNPFNPKTTIRFTVGAQSAGDQTAVPVKLEIFNLLGQAVKTLINDQRAPGLYRVEWDGTDIGGNRVSSGIYFYRLSSRKEFSETKKMLFVK